MCEVHIPLAVTEITKTVKRMDVVVQFGKGLSIARCSRSQMAGTQCLSVRVCTVTTFQEVSDGFSIEGNLEYDYLLYERTKFGINSRCDC